MASMFRNFTVAAILLSTGFAMAACGDEDNNENNTPEIYLNVVEPLYQKLSNETNCSNILHASTNVNLTQVAEACKAYQKSLQDAGNKPGNLIEKWDNSGYYLASYILIDQLHSRAIGCQPDTSATTEQAKNAFESIFNSPGCETFLSDADSINSKRGSRR